MVNEHKPFTEDELTDIERLADMGHGVDDLVARHLVEEIRALREVLKPFANRCEEVHRAESSKQLATAIGLREHHFASAARALGMEE